MGQRVTSKGSSPKKNSPWQSTVSDCNESQVTVPGQHTPRLKHLGDSRICHNVNGGKSEHARQSAVTKNHERGVVRGYILVFD